MQGTRGSSNIQQVACRCRHSMFSAPGLQHTWHCWTWIVRSESFLCLHIYSHRFKRPRWAGRGRTILCEQHSNIASFANENHVCFAPSPPKKDARVDLYRARLAVYPSSRKPYAKSHRIAQTEIFFIRSGNLQKRLSPHFESQGTPYTRRK